jgi:hypothetical protein
MVLYMTENYRESFADDPVAQSGQSGPLEEIRRLAPSPLNPLEEI